MDTKSNKTKSTKNIKLQDIKPKSETPLEKALRLGNDELIAKAISDMLMRDDLQDSGLTDSGKEVH